MMHVSFPGVVMFHSGASVSKPKLCNLDIECFIVFQTQLHDVFSKSDVEEEGQIMYSN